MYRSPGVHHKVYPAGEVPPSGGRRNPPLSL